MEDKEILENEKELENTILEQEIVSTRKLTKEEKNRIINYVGIAGLNLTAAVTCGYSSVLRYIDDDKLYALCLGVLSVVNAPIAIAYIHKIINTYIELKSEKLDTENNNSCVMQILDAKEEVYHIMQNEDEKTQVSKDNQNPYERIR